MTIQEVIEHCGRQIKYCISPILEDNKIYTEHFYVKKWLEELLILREEVTNLRKKLASLEEEKVKFRWHDLTVSEDDLPECEMEHEHYIGTDVHEIDDEVVFDDYKSKKYFFVSLKDNAVYLAKFCIIFENGKEVKNSHWCVYFNNNDEKTDFMEVEAWREIEPFKEGEEY